WRRVCAEVDIAPAERSISRRDVDMFQPLPFEGSLANLMPSGLDCTPAGCPAPAKVSSMMIGNPVRTRLQAGLPVFGITITTPSVEAAAHAATLGFHFLWVEMEHSPVTLETLRL